MIQTIKNNIPFQVRITLISFINLIIVFNIWKIIFFYSYIDEFTGPTLLYIKSIFVGLKSDAVIAGQLSIIIFIISFIPKIKFVSYIKSAYYIYMFLLYIIIGFLNVIDLEFFKEMGVHLNMQAQMYGFESGKEPWIQVWVSYPIFSYLFIIAFISYMMHKISKIWIPRSKKTDSLNQKKRNVATVLLFIFLLIVGTNGFGKTPFNPKKSFFSKDVMANQLAINSIQYYIYSMINEPDLIFYSTEEAVDIFNDLLDGNKSETRLDDNGIITIPEIQISNDSLNIVLIILESHTAIHCNYLNPDLKDTISPFLDSLSKKSINFKNCYSNGTRTAYGLSSILCSWPVVPGYPLNRYPKYQNQKTTKPTFSSILKRINNGYKTIFMYGGDSEFDQMKPFVKANQFDEVIDRIIDNDLQNLTLDNKNQGVNPWGIFDEHLFKKYIELMDNNKEKFTFTTILSTTNHIPWIIPDSLKSKIPNYTSNKKNFEVSKKTMRYVDLVLERFFKEAENKDWFNNTIFIITADHGLNIYKEHINDSRNGLIPFLIYNKNLTSYPEIEKIVSHIDILPTLLDLIRKIDYFPNKENELFGCSGFKGTNGFAFRNNDNNIQWIENGFVYSENLGFDFDEYYSMKDFKIISSDLLKEAMKRKCRAYAQMGFEITR